MPTQYLSPVKCAPTQYLIHSYVPEESLNNCIYFFSAWQPIGVKNMQIYFRGHFSLPNNQFDCIPCWCTQVPRFSLFLLICEIIHHINQICATSLFEFPKKKHIWLEHWKYTSRFYRWISQHWTDVCHLL